MNAFLTHVLINNTDNSDHQLCNFILDGLTDYDKMKVVLEQAIYYSYLKVTTGDNSVVEDISKSVHSMYLQLKRFINTENKVHNDFYITGMETISSILNDKLTRGNFDYSTVVAIFSEKVEQTYYGNLYVPTITKVFLDIWCNMMTGWYNKDEYPEGIMYDSALYTPNVTTIKGSNSQNTVTSYRVAITLNPISIKQFFFSGSPALCLACLFRNCDFSEYNLNDIPAIFSSFCIDHSKYVMTNSPDVTFVDVCFDMVTGSSFTCKPAGKDCIIDREPWIDCIRDMISNNRLSPVLDGELFGELLARIGENSDLVNYFKKPITTITATEALAFRKSVFAEFLTDKFAVGLEALDDGESDKKKDDSDDDDKSDDESDDKDDSDTSEDNSDDSTDDTDSDDTDTDDQTDDDSSGTDTDTDSTDDTESSQPAEDKPAENVRPQIDPGKMLLELANPSDSMSDYIYRETVSRRIASLLKNPPENAMPNDLLMLKRWRSRWLYLASIACLRDFLTRVSLRLSNV